MSKGQSPVQRRVRVLREKGSICQCAERWNPYGGTHGIREDLFGIIA